MQDYYRILGVSEKAGAQEIRRAYLKLARQHHPDVTGDSDGEAFKRLQEAYAVLSDQERRRSRDSRDLYRYRPEPVRPLRHEWFTDEIAIDFPSIDNLVDRIRESFFGGDAQVQPISAEILLSPREAFDGVRVPLDIPVRATCVRCGGRGEVWMDRCAACAGSGEAASRYRVELLLPPGVRDGARFRFTVNPLFALPAVIEVRIALE
jgi:DnaJ-class molecular chaperone